LYWDQPTKVLVHADVNGARNIGFLTRGLRSDVDLRKYRNPLKLTSDIAFCRITRAGIG
jgi:hypothetical protein